MLNSTCQANEQSYAIDIFDRQDLNIDLSGQGNRAAFEHNLALYDRHRGANVTIIAGDSTDPEMDSAIKGRVRLFSVDGGHTAEHTINDLRLAQRRIAAEGVVILDDILNGSWLGVVEGAVRFLLTGPTLVPFAVGYNKMLMCNLSYARRYCELIASSNLCRKAEVEFCGHRVVAM